MKDQMKALTPATQPITPPRPTIRLADVIAADTATFSGWGPKVAGTRNVLKNWN